MRTIVPVLALSLASVALAGCPGFEETAYYDQIRWSDDDEQLAIVELRFEEAPPSDPLMGTTQKRNFRHQLFVSDPDGSNPTPVGDEQPGQNGAEVYFMRSQGYVLLTSLNEQGGVEYARVDTGDGTVTALPAPGFDADPTFALPSPDGTEIAQIGIDGLDVLVRFFDAASLEPVADAVTVTLDTTADWTFREDGALVVTDGTSAKAVRPGEAPTDTDVPTCTNPKTTSSDVSSMGVRVFTEEGEIVTRDEGAEAAFGCQ